MYFLTNFLESLKVVRFKEIPEYFGLSVLMFKAAGNWVPHPNVEFSTKFSIYSYNLFLFITAGSMVYFEIASLPDSYDQNLTAFIKNVSLLTTHLMTLVKFIFWARNRAKLFGVLNKLDDLQHVHGDYVVDSELGRNAPTPMDVYEEDFLPDEIMSKQKKLSDLALKLFFWNASMVSLSAGMAAAYILFFDYKDNYFEVVVGHNVSVVRYDQELAYYSTIPFDYNTGRHAFFWAIVYQVYGLGYYAWNIIAFDTLFACIMSFVCGHVIIVQGAFRTIRGRCLKRLQMKDDPLIIEDVPELQKAMHEEFKKCAKHLQQIFISTDALEEMFTFITFMQVGMTLVVFCTNLYIVSSLPVSTRFTAEIVYLTAVLNEMMLYCLFGHRVTINTETIPSALFEGDWLSASVSFKRSMLITMTRMSRPIQFTIGKFSPLTLSTFVSICRGSYSFFTVLKTRST